ncbi:hypothetical protein ACEN8K_43390, partial [Variovorax sp. CT11-76]
PPPPPFFLIYPPPPPKNNLIWGARYIFLNPTATTLLDLRGSGDDRPPLQERVMLQDGAVPGPLSRLYEEMLAIAWTLRHIGARAPSPRAHGRGIDPLAASPELAAHSQLLLAMGHDSSQGRAVWVPEMDGIAPYWPRPQEAPTYAAQQRMFDAGTRRDGVHLHLPTWQALPPSGCTVIASASGFGPDSKVAATTNSGTASTC